MTGLNGTLIRVRHQAMIRAAEIELMRSSTRSKSPRVQELLHEEFVEIGRSGRRWTRDEIVSSLAAERDYVQPDVSEWAFVELSVGLVLVTYLAHAADFESRHASIWDISVTPPQMRFHQGTIVRGSGSVR